MTNNKIIKEVFKDFGESVYDLTGSQLIAIEECMNISRDANTDRLRQTMRNILNVSLEAQKKELMKK